jgi:class 3 adenylate cyclase
MSEPTLSFELFLNASPAQVWPFVTDTDRLNAATGLPRVNYRDEPQEAGLSRRLFSFHYMGVDFVGQEHPSIWHQNHFFEIHRSYSSGPFVDLRFRVELEPSPAQPDSGCLCRYLYWIEPRGEPGQMFLTGMEEGLLATIQQLLQEAVANLTAASPTGSGLSVAPHEPSPSTVATIERLSLATRELHDSPVLDQLVDSLLHAHDLDLQRIRPLRFARDRKLNPDDTLSTLLAATRSGLLKMSWQLVCPHCKGGKTGTDSLGNITSTGYCAACDIDFEVDLSRALELVFKPHPQVREIDDFPYCLAGPSSTPHVLYQRLLSPNEICNTTLDLPAGAYRIRSDGVEGHLLFELTSSRDVLKDMPGLEDLGQGIKLKLADGLDPETMLAFYSEPSLPFSVHNDSGQPVVLRIEDMNWPSDSLVAADVISLQQFRDLFDSQLLATGVSLGVENLTIVFTDLVGSTAMYEALGDSQAFSLVWDHFDVIKEILSEHRGALIKTIGDAVMAAFSKPESAQLAACAMQEQITKAMVEQGYDYPVHLKMGIHTGSAITITANGRLDYFGSAVNLAARTESRSQGQDIVITVPHAEATDSARLLRDRGWTAEKLTTELKGFGQPIELLRFIRATPAD